MKCNHMQCHQCEDVAKRLVELEQAEQRAREERDEAERAVKDLMAEASLQAARADGLAEQVRRVWQYLNIAGMPATPDVLVEKYREVERERDNLRACNEAMRKPMQLLRELASMPAEGESAVVERVIAMFRAAERREAGLTEGLRLVSDALARLSQIYRSDIDLGDPPVETPAWLQEALEIARRVREEERAACEAIARRCVEERNRQASQFPQHDERRVWSNLKASEAERIADAIRDRALSEAAAPPARKPAS